MDFITSFIYSNRKILCLIFKLLSTRQSSDMSKFKYLLDAGTHVVVLSGAGISAESGIPTFRGTDGLWRKLEASLLASPAVFRDNPSLVWEFYHYRRELVLKLKPNAGHIAVAQYAARHASDKNVSVITQNVDGLHAKAGSKKIIELHGNLFKTRCTKCNEVLVNSDSPICEALADRGCPTSGQLTSDIPVKDLPHCKKPDCGGLLRPHVIWFGETLDPAVKQQTDGVISKCNVCLVVGTSSLVYPAAAFPTIMTVGGSIVAEFNIEPDGVISKCNVCLVVGTSSLVYPAAAFPTIMTVGGSIVAEFNIEPGPSTHNFDFYFEGPSARTLPLALSD